MNQSGIALSVTLDSRLWWGCVWRWVLGGCWVGAHDDRGRAAADAGAPRGDRGGRQSAALKSAFVTDALVKGLQSTVLHTAV